MASKKEQKQFPIDNRENCIIYLQQIISTAEKCLIHLKKYNKQSETVLNDYNKKLIPYEIYSETVDKTSSVTNYLLNILGDAQESSISYFKYRKQAERLILKNVKGVALANLTNEHKEFLSEFNKLRNWQNHIPESLLVSEYALIKEGKLGNHSSNPIEIILYTHVEYEYFKDLHDSNCGFYTVARTLVQASKRDYSCLLDESVKIEKIYSDTPLSIKISQASRLSAKTQGIKDVVLLDEK